MKKEYDFSKGKRGAVVPVPPGKTRITIRLDDDVIDFCRIMLDGMLQNRCEHCARIFRIDVDAARED